MQKIISDCAKGGFSLAEVSRLSGVRDRQWRRWQSGQAIPRPSNLRRMEKAIVRLCHERDRTIKGEAVLSPVAYRMVLITLADKAGVNVAAVLADDPQSQDKQSPIKAAASLCRQRALYLIVTELNVPLVIAAGFAGITKQAVSKSLRQIEESRDDPHINALLDSMADLIHGTSRSVGLTILEPIQSHQRQEASVKKLREPDQFKRNNSHG
ncbi:hypothetical protein [Cohaesibacter celericrescens]|nr:hypothetical protein [Cohaesibacter celericrescens]